MAAGVVFPMKKKPFDRLFGSSSSSSSSSSSTETESSFFFGRHKKTVHPQNRASDFIENTEKLATHVATTAKETASTVVTKTKNTAVHIKDNVETVAKTVQDNVETVAKELHDNAEAAKNKVNGLIQQGPKVNHKKQQAPTLLSHFKYTYENNIILSTTMATATRTLMYEFSVKKDPEYDDEFILIWKPNDDIVDENVAILSKAQDLMCSQLFATHRYFDFNKSDKQLDEQYALFGSQVAEVLAAGNAQTLELFSKGIEPNDIYQNFNTYCMQINDLYDPIAPGPITALNQVIKNMTKVKRLKDDSREFLDKQILSIDKNTEELSGFISDIIEAMREEINEMNPQQSFYEDQLEIYSEQKNTLTDINNILKTIISRQIEDPMSHCITPENYTFIKNHPRTPNVPKQVPINETTDKIAHSMIIIKPGIKDIRSGIDAVEDRMVSTLLESAAKSMSPFLAEMAAVMLEQDMSVQKTAFKIATYLNLITAFYNRIPILSSIHGNMLYRQKERDVGVVLRRGAEFGDIEAFIPGSQQFNADMQPIKERTETFLLTLVDEINHQINGVNEGAPGFLSKPDEALAKSIVEKLKCFDIVITAYGAFIDDEKEEAVQNLSQFHVNGDNITRPKEVVRKLFDIFTQSITHYIDVSELEETTAALKAAVKGYTTLQTACSHHMPDMKPSALNIESAAHNIKNRYIQKLKLIEDISIFTMIRRVMSYCANFYTHVSGPLNIKWILNEELMLELIEVLISNPGYMGRSYAIKDIYHRDFYTIISLLRDPTDSLSPSPLVALYTRIFPVDSAEAVQNPRLSLKPLTISPYLEQYTVESLYVKAVGLVLKNNPHIHEISFEQGLSIDSLLWEFAKASEQVDSYIFNGNCTLENWELGQFMNRSPGIQLQSAKTVIDETKNIVQTIITRSRPIPEQVGRAVIQTIDIEAENESAPLVAATQSHTRTENVQTHPHHFRLILQNKVADMRAKAIAKKDIIAKKFARELEEFNKDKVKYLTEDLFKEWVYEPTPPPPPPVPIVPVVDKNDLTPHIKSLEEVIKDTFRSEQDREIYALLVKHHMKPKNAFDDAYTAAYDDDAVRDALFDTFNGVAIRIVGLSPSIEFIKDMAYLSLSNKNVFQAATWTQRLIEKDTGYHAILAYTLITEHAEKLRKHSKYLSTLNGLIANIDNAPFNLMPHHYITLITALFNSKEYTRDQMLTLIDAYLRSRDCLHDYNDFKAVNAHYDIMKECIDRTVGETQSAIFNLLLRSNVYGEMTTRKYLAALFADSAASYTADQLESTLKKVDTFNLRIAEHVKNLITGNELIPDEAIDLNKLEFNFDHHMMVLINNQSEGIAETPLHEKDNSVQNELDRAFIIGLIQYFKEFKECVNFTAHAGNYLTHLSTLTITEKEMCQVIDAITQLTLANMRNIENKIVLIIEMISQKFNDPSEAVKEKITALKQHVIKRKLTKTMDSILFHFNAKLLPDEEVVILRKDIIDIMNEQDSKALSKSLSEITKSYRTLLGSEVHDFETIKQVRLELDYIIGFCERIRPMNEDDYFNAHRKILIEASRIGISPLAIEINDRLAPLLSKLGSKPSVADIDTLKAKVQGMYSKIIEILVMKSLPFLDGSEDFMIIKNMLDAIKHKSYDSNIIVSSAYAAANIQSRYTLSFHSREERGIEKLLKSITPAMIDHIDAYTINMLQRCVSAKIPKPSNINNLQFIM